MRHRMKRKKLSWLIYIGNTAYKVFESKTFGNAARQAIKLAISRGQIKKQPPADGDGGWKGVSFRVI